MQPVELPGSGLSVSPLCLGGTSFGVKIDERETFRLLDHFLDAGGNFIDTARIYSDWVPGETGRSERILGDWMRTRGNRDRLVVSTKGAHPLLESFDVPRSSETEIRGDVELSLRALGVETIDLYWLHRDDPARPAGHFIDVLNVLAREGKIRAFGASNWTTARLREARDHAQASGQKGFVANQPRWSLGSQKAKPPGMPGMVTFDSEADRFHKETGMAVVPYSSQAAGFFSQLALPEPDRPEHFSKSDYNTPQCIAAGRVAIELARAHGVSPSALVLAYLRARSYPVAPIVGCRTPAQVDDSIRALEVGLTADEMRALEVASESGLG